MWYLCVKLISNLGRAISFTHITEFYLASKDSCFWFNFSKCNIFYLEKKSAELFSIFFESSFIIFIFTHPCRDQTWDEIENRIKVYSTIFNKPTPGRDNPNVKIIFVGGSQKWKYIFSEWSVGYIFTWYSDQWWVISWVSDQLDIFSPGRGETIWEATYLSLSIVCRGGRPEHNHTW